MVDPDISEVGSLRAGRDDRPASRELIRNGKLSRNLGERSRGVVVQDTSSVGSVRVNEVRGARDELAGEEHDGAVGRVAHLCACRAK